MAKREGEPIVSDYRWCMVIYQNDDGITCPMTWDADCAGAICACFDAGDRPVIFPNRNAARQAIAISRAKMRLDQVQGKPSNEDFNQANAKCIKIVSVQFAEVKENQS